MLKALLVATALFVGGTVPLHPATAPDSLSDSQGEGDLAPDASKLVTKIDAMLQHYSAAMHSPAHVDSMLMSVQTHGRIVILVFKTEDGTEAGAILGWKKATKSWEPFPDVFLP
jgi:hypothetical protein